MTWRILSRKIILCWLVIVLSMSVVTSVLANAAAPPSLNWLKFESKEDIRGVQIAQCRDSRCQQSLLLTQYGKCDLQGCIPGPAKSLSINPLRIECAENLCMISLPLPSSRQELDITKLQIRALIKDRVFASKTFSLNDDRERPSKSKVSVIGNNLELSPNANFSIAESTLWRSLFLVALVMTIAIESAIWAGYLRWRERSSEIKETILSLVLVEAFSLPIIWLFVPGIHHFANDRERYVGWVWLILSLGYGAILFVWSLLRKSMRWQTIMTGSIAYWVGTFLVTVIVSAVFSYGPSVPSAAPGISRLPAIAIGEILVIFYEAVLMQRLRRDSLKFKTALGVSIIANLASFLAGLAFS
jgi:hypothetical protein